MNISSRPTPERSDVRLPAANTRQSAFNRHSPTLPLKINSAAGFFTSSSACDHSSRNNIPTRGTSPVHSPGPNHFPSGVTTCIVVLVGIHGGRENTVSGIVELGFLTGIRNPFTSTLAMVASMNWTTPTGSLTSRASSSADWNAPSVLAMPGMPSRTIPDARTECRNALRCVRIITDFAVSISIIFSSLPVIGRTNKKEGACVSKGTLIHTCYCVNTLVTLFSVGLPRISDSYTVPHLLADRCPRRPQQVAQARVAQPEIVYLRLQLGDVGGFLNRRGGEIFLFPQIQRRDRNVQARRHGGGRLVGIDPTFHRRLLLSLGKFRRSRHTRTPPPYVGPLTIALGNLAALVR